MGGGKLDIEKRRTSVIHACGAAQSMLQGVDGA